MKELKLFLLMWPRPHRLKENCLIYIPGVSPRSYTASAVFPAMLQQGTAGKIFMSFHDNKRELKGFRFLLNSV